MLKINKLIVLRIHSTTEKAIDLSRIYIQGKQWNASTTEKPLKPWGLWYGIGDSWKEWVVDNMPDWKKENDFALTIGMDRVCIIETKEDILNFHDKYAVPYWKGSGICWIDWERVAADYAGIEFQNYWKWKSAAMDDRPYRNDGFYLSASWIFSIDVPSGCIWNLSIIENVEPCNKLIIK